MQIQNYFKMSVCKIFVFFKKVQNTPRSASANSDKMLINISESAAN